MTVDINTVDARRTRESTRRSILVIYPFTETHDCTVATTCGKPAEWSLAWPKSTRRACDAHMAAAVRSAFHRYNMLVKVRATERRP